MTATLHDSENLLLPVRRTDASHKIIKKEKHPLVLKLTKNKRGTGGFKTNQLTHKGTDT